MFYNVAGQELIKSRKAANSIIITLIYFPSQVKGC